MASGGSNRDAKDALSKLLQIGTVAEYDSKFVILTNRVTQISENLLKAFYISGHKPTLQCALLRSNPTTLSEAFSLARAMEARFVEDALSKLLQTGMVAEYQNEFEILISRVTGKSKFLLIMGYISRLKVALQIYLLRERPTTIGEAFSLTRLIEAHFEAIIEKDKQHIIKKKANTILLLQSELASPEVKGSLDVDEHIGVNEVSSTIDGVLDSGESNVESMEVRSKFGEFSENKKVWKRLL
nr:retrotransposon Gag protein [Tanacetum cinerariifolium]